MDYTQYVNPNIGTVGHLLTATAPTVQSPHGAALVEPVFRAGMKDRYFSDRIFGFTAGCATVMPTFLTGTPVYEETASTFDHDLEEAGPDFYRVLLEDTGIEERHTAFRNYGQFSFTYPRAEGAGAVIYIRNCRECRVEDGRLYATGSQSFGVGRPISTLLDLTGALQVQVCDTTVPNQHDPKVREPAKAVAVRWNREQVFLPFVLSPMGFESLARCYDREVRGKDFQTVRELCREAWNGLLGKLRVTGGTLEEKRVFYTAVYRATSRMHNYSVDGEYLGFDGQIHRDEGHAFYCDDGIWDTFRGMHPLQLLLEPEVHRDVLESYLRMYRQSGWLPRFPYLGGNVPCMIGHHTVSIFAGAAAKGVEFDWALAFEAAYKNATRRTMLPWRDGEAEELTRCYYEKGFFPAQEENEPETCPAVHPFENRQAVAVTIEHSYDDWCVAQLARALGREREAETFLARSQNYKRLYDPAIGFFHPRKADGSFTRDYNPKFCGGQGGRRYYAENNAYIYRYAAQHDIPGTVALMGGQEAFARSLDNLYVEQYDGVLKSTFLMQYPDATGLMGQFCMGNEPSFHIPYLYNYCGQAYKTQRKIHELIRLWFRDTPLGICGDEDGGAMSAFLVFSAMGFYQVNPASDVYDLGSPIFDKIELDLPNGKTFTLLAEGASRGAKYIQSAVLNGQTLAEPRFTHSQLMEGGTLVLTMDQRPNRELFA